ncbi:PIN domain-like protein [Rhizodiscina lignyota]|uniref:PIN domain-like protein n=1 Tax=Rhizodiscina lignyota TaxID=1504668 RepID=A0A9P4IP39_9PEZI|nr:PIN domain-like protein [Rhizodiscina lignyota]
MGVTGLWTVVQPCARPIKIETLNKKRLAVDASIWIYQFLKAVRDKEGNALRNSHVVGFFRRICKLLFFGIKPVFVFDGGAPALKRQTISGRKARREGRREDAVRTAGKLLAVQMQRRAEEEERKRKEERARPAQDDNEEALPENLVYVDELHMDDRERQQNRKFKKKDAYHLPELDMSLAEMGAPNDPRIMSLEELEQYARQFDTGEDINVYDFSKIDFDSPFFVSLPASDRYNILNAARLRSRLRMGYSKDQLDSMFPDRMAFSKFQIERVRERNELTQRLMHINGMGDDGTFGVDGTGRVAGEKGREYVLVKNDGVEGGWALGVVSSKEEGERTKPIDVDALDRPETPVLDDEDWEDEDEFEDVPIEGLNRLAKRRPNSPEGDSTAGELAQRRQKFYKSRNQNHSNRSSRRAPVNEEPDSLFVADDDDEEEWEDVAGTNAAAPQASGNQFEDEEARDLQRAIEMSLENDRPPSEAEAEDDDYEEVFNQTKAPEATPFTGGSGTAIARMANSRSNKVTVSGPFAESDSENEDFNLRGALAESRRSKYKARSVRPAAPIVPRPKAREGRQIKSPTTTASKAAGFDGPLPFEKLDLGSSLLGKKRMKQLEEDASGGFEKDVGEGNKKRDAVPVPPWFSSDMQNDMSAQKVIEQKDREEERLAKEKEAEDGFIFQQRPALISERAKEIIDLDAEPIQGREVSDLEADEMQDGHADTEVLLEDPELRMGDLADKVRAEPPPLPDGTEEHVRTQEQNSKSVNDSVETANTEAPSKPDRSPEESDEEMLDWSDSDEERPKSRPQDNVTPAGGELRTVGSPSPSPEFEDVLTTSGIPAVPEDQPQFHPTLDDTASGPIPASGLADQDIPIDLDAEEFEELYSDPEDEELFRQLAQEEEEHARFASSLNNGASADPTGYEKELRQLRNQQKKDRRDADEVTQVMIQECQQLLALFGLPYVTAPMEAEAQCAELVNLGLVDGIVTDDSDTFLFGGTRVYKNMFNQAKFVECYLSQDLQSEFGLTRDRLIAIAQLLGSDYTEGLPGVGPVTALEIISEFDDLNAFKDWWTEVQTGLRSKADDAGNSFRKKFRRNATKLFLPLSFPDPRVEQAYLKPDVDSDPQPFVWGVPDLNALRSFLMSTIGWSQERTDEILVPVIKDMNRRMDEGTQSNITNFFYGGVGAGAFAPRRREEGKSKRMETALGKMKERARGDTIGEGGAENTEELDDNSAAEGVANGDEADTRSGRSGTSNRKKRTKSKSVKRVEVGVVSEDDEEEYVESRKKKRLSKKKA